MRPLTKFFLGLTAFSMVGLSVIRITPAQQSVETPSQKTREAVEKFTKAPATIGKSLKALTEAAKGKLEQAVGGKKQNQQTSEDQELALPPRKAEPPASASFSPEGRRDPFRPYNRRTKTTSRARENLSPLERFELSQLKVVGVVWDIKEPRAMIEDTAGLGYIVTVGTPIGSKEGKVKAIHRNEVVVEESYEDFYGAKKKRDVSMKFSVD